MTRLVTRELKRVLCRELLGAKVSQVACPNSQHNAGEERADFNADLTYAGTAFRLHGNMKRRQTCVAPGFKEHSVVFHCEIVLDGDVVAQIAYDRRGKRFAGRTDGKSEPVYTTQKWMLGGATRSEFLGEVASAIADTHQIQAQEEAEQRVEKMAKEAEAAVAASAGDVRSRRSLLAS
jgi:hypothetical protein